MSNEWTSRAPICPCTVLASEASLEKLARFRDEHVTNLRRTSAGRSGFPCLYGLDSTREPPETEACALDLRRRDRPMLPSEPALVPTQLTPAPVPASVSPAVTSKYEFSYSENSIIRNLGSKMSFVGLFMLGIGLFFFISVIIRWVQSH